MISIDLLRARRAQDIDVVLPGHGEPRTDHADLIDKRSALHERRAEKLYGFFAERPRTTGEAFLTLSEVLGHLDLLVNAGQIVEVPGQDRHVPGHVIQR